MINNRKSWIYVKFQREGIHKYPAALTDPKLATGGADDVSFLGYPHRHMFHFNVRLEIFHDDRDVEFIKFKREIMNYMNDKYGDKECLKFVKMSCEMIAKELLNEFKLIKCEVSEDNENGAIVYGE